MVTPNRQFSVHNRPGGGQYAVRRGREVPLDRYRMELIVDELSAEAARYFQTEVTLDTPVDTGLLQSRWRRVGLAVVNDTPYLPHVMRRNPFVTDAFAAALEHIRLARSNARPARTVKRL